MTDRPELRIWDAPRPDHYDDEPGCLPVWILLALIAALLFLAAAMAIFFKVWSGS